MPTTPRPLSPALAALMALACGAWLPAQSSADAGVDWKPRKSTEFIVPSGAGAALDVAARKLTELLTREKLAPGFIVSNKSSAHGIVALEYDRQLYRSTLVGEVPVGADGRASTALQGDPVLAAHGAAY